MYGPDGDVRTPLMVEGLRGGVVGHSCPIVLKNAVGADGDGPLEVPPLLASPPTDPAERGMTRNGAPRQERKGSASGPYGFDVDLDLHVVAKHDATALGGTIPLHAVVHPVHGGGRVESDAVTLTRLLDAVEVPVEHDALRHATHRERAIDLPIVAAALDARALEGDRRKAVGREEVSRTEIGIAAIVVRRDARRSDLDVDLSVLPGIGIGRDRALEI